jgi:hypothetical protein
MVLPDGFSSLVELVIQDWDWEELPTQLLKYGMHYYTQFF